METILNGVYILHETLGVKTVDGWNSEDNDGVVGILVVEDNHKIVVALEDAPEKLNWLKTRELVNESVDEFTLVLEDGHKIVVALEDAIYNLNRLKTRKPVNGSVDELKDAKDDFNGEIYCQKLNYPEYSAAYYCLNYKKSGRSWYLPSSGELWLIRRHLFEIQTALETVGGQKFVTEKHIARYWSSTEHGVSPAIFAWTLDFGILHFYNCGSKINSEFWVRPVSNFIENKNLKESSAKKKDSSNCHSQTSDQSVQSINISSNDSRRNIIDVYRKDGSIRKVSIMKDRNTGKFCFVNLTSSYVCKCRFETFDDAIADLKMREEVEHFDIHYVKDSII